ncbi:HK97 gp10 family phage protein [Nocardia carnea]|uniref:HK97 gp10 family phage protein n=1 Tax=Nocardia carnea TaxID=37328 RepID=UPI0024538A66|nr:HK97 gp10 family phage protein [Nocardia carnea]
MAGFRARLRAVFNRIPGVEQYAVARSERRMDDLGRRIIINARGRINSRTGELERSLGYRTTRQGSRVRLTVFATAPHAKWVHDGTRPHVILPRRAKALKFQAGGRTVFAARVNHPGTRGTRFLAKAVEDETRRRV